MWTEQRTQRLRQLWSQGWSAGEIARDLGREIGHKSGQKTGEASGSLSRSAVLGRLHRLGLGHDERERAQAPAAPRPPTLYGDMTPDACRWFLEPFDLPPMERLVCGEKTRAGSSYCPAHHARVWETPPQTPHAAWLREQRTRDREMLARLRARREARGAGDAATPAPEPTMTSSPGAKV